MMGVGTSSRRMPGCLLGYVAVFATDWCVGCVDTCDWQGACLKGVARPWMQPCINYNCNTMCAHGASLFQAMPAICKALLLSAPLRRPLIVSTPVGPTSPCLGAA